MTCKKCKNLNDQEVLDVAKRLAAWQYCMDWEYMHRNERESCLTEARELLRKRDNNLAAYKAAHY